MQRKELVDINLDLQTRRRRFRRRLLRVITPLGCVLLIVAAIMTITAVSYSNNRRDTLALSDELLAALDQRIQSEVNAYLMPASNLVTIGAEATREYLDKIWSPDRTPLGIELIKTYPQLSSFFGGDPNGNFVMHEQTPEGTIDTKVIERSPSNVAVTWIRRDAAGRVVKKETSGDDGYDPRLRPWYREAARTRRLQWSDVYIFYTAQTPGLTVSYPLYSQNDQLLAVFGIDIKLEKISTFLADLKIGDNGRALIIEDDGMLVAYPEMARAFKRSGDTLEMRMLDELDEPVLTRALNRFKVEGHGKRTLVVDDRRFLNTVTSLKSTVGRDWSVMIIVSEDDFVGFLRTNLRKVLLMTSVIVIVSAILAALLVYQGLRADRNAALVLARKQELEAQSRAFSELAAKTALWDPEDIESLQGLTEIVSAAMAVRRASVWGYHEDERILRCEDSFDRGANGHTRGTVLKLADYPRLFHDLIKGEDIIINDSADDPRTRQLHRVYLEPLGCAALLAVPVMPGGRLVGAVWFEHEETVRSWGAEDIAFARAIAGMLALRLSATGVPYAAAGQGKSDEMAGDLRDPISTSVSVSALPAADEAGSDKFAMPVQAGGLAKDRGRKTSFSERLRKQGLDRNRTTADVYDNVTVLVLRFTDPFILAQHFGNDNPTTAIDHLACLFEDLLEARRIDYWKIINDQIVCAAGLHHNSPHPVDDIADLALSFQDKCSRLFTDLDQPMEFKIGIDTGGIIGSAIGRRQKSYNIWGEAVSTAAMMADQGVRGAIQVSETAYRHLQRNYLFRARGRYFLQHIGEISTYLLTGRI